MYCIIMQLFAKVIHTRAHMNEDLGTALPFSPNNVKYMQMSKTVKKTAT